MPTTSRNPALALAFGQTVRRVRESAGVAQEALALIPEMDRSYLGRLERGEKQPSLDVVFRLAVALGVVPGDLVAKIEVQARKAKKVKRARG